MINAKKKKSWVNEQSNRGGGCCFKFGNRGWTFSLMTFEWGPDEVREWVMQIWERRIPSSGNSQCKRLRRDVVGCSRRRKWAGMARVGWVRRKVVGCEIQKIWSVVQGVTYLPWLLQTSLGLLCGKYTGGGVGMEKEEAEKLIRILRCY